MAIWTTAELSRPACAKPTTRVAVGLRLRGSYTAYSLESGGHNSSWPEPAEPCSLSRARLHSSLPQLRVRGFAAVLANPTGTTTRTAAMQSTPMPTTARRCRLVVNGPSDALATSRSSPFLLAVTSIDSVTRTTLWRKLGFLPQHSSTNRAVFHPTISTRHY
jgi:hypothetical protein